MIVLLDLRVRGPRRSNLYRGSIPPYTNAYYGSEIEPSALARKPSKSGPGGPDSSPPDPVKPSFSFGEVDDFSPGLEGLVGDQFWHP